jgi:aspartate-semialdehyde dehydrogenase
MAQGLNLALLGASSLAAENLLSLLEASRLPVKRLVALDEQTGLGKTLEFKGHHVPLSPLEGADFGDLDLVLATVPLDAGLVQRIQEEDATLVTPAGCLPDADAGYGLMLAGQNLQRASLRRGMVLALPSALDSLLARLLAPVEEEFGIRALAVNWTRSVSHDGRRAIEVLAAETAQLLNGRKPKAGRYAQRIAFNLLPEHVEPCEASFLQLWEELWGRTGLAYSLQTQIAPVFYGDVLNLVLDMAVTPEETEFEALLRAQADVEVLATASQLGTDTQPRQGEALMRVARPRLVAGVQGRFVLTVLADVGRAGLARNQIECAEFLAKTLFFN